jgi:hypothetical protein
MTFRRLIPVLAISLKAALATDLIPCSKNEAAGAQRLLRSIEDGLDSGSFVQASEAWAAVLNHRCFALTLAQTSSTIRFDNVLAARWWWHQGGSEWMYSALSPDRMVIPPDWLPTVFDESSHLPKQLRCPQADERNTSPGVANQTVTCGTKTRGWRLRAEQFFDHQGYSRTARWNERAAVERCADRLREKSDRFQKWRGCLEGQRRLHPAMPLGESCAPTSGWLTLRGRRGHYNVCDEIRAYDLDTGTFHLAQQCSTPNLYFEARASSAGIQVSSGHLPIEALREAAWMIFLAPDVEEGVQTISWSVALPRELKPSWPPEDPARRLLRKLKLGPQGGFSIGSGDNVLQWSWAQSTGVPRVERYAQGTLSWRTSNWAGEAYAVNLLVAAEAAMALDCPTAEFPTALVDTPDAGPGAPVSLEGQLWRALSQPRTSCPPSKHP